MDKELEVIKRDLDYKKCLETVKKQPNCCLAPRVNAINIVEKKLKALEIIKNRECIFKGLQDVSQEEYELLKEIL